MKKILLLLAIVAFASCSDDNEFIPNVQQEHTDAIMRCESRLDYIASIFPLSDTIGGTDAYMELCEAYEEYKRSADTASKERAYEKYMQNYERVIELYYELVNE